MTASLHHGEQLADRLQQLRQHMAAAGLDGWIIGREDMYQGEEVPAGNERLAFLSGFTGSAGFAVVLAETAVLFSDGRYSLQMQDQSDAALWQTRTLPDDRLEIWLADNLPDNFETEDTGPLIGVDGRLITLAGFERMQIAVQKSGASLRCHTANLLDMIWSDRPPQPPAAPWLMPDACSGKTTSEKLAALTISLRNQACDAVLLTRVDAVNWLVNMRGADLPCTPVNLCFGLFIIDQGLYLFGDMDRLPKLDAAISIAPLSDLPDLLAGMNCTPEDSHAARLMIDAASLPKTIYDQIIDMGFPVLKAVCPLSPIKAQKTAAEIAGFRAAHIRDGVAMVEFLSWLDTVTASQFSECAIAEKLMQFRQLQAGFLAPSFATIAGSGPNGAIVHYRAIEGADRCPAKDDLLLLDSGAHYTDGTTDITRTIAIGTPPMAAIFAFTQVLKAHINLDVAVFPIGTNGQQLDALARAPLWASKMDYAHGTGHGVGHVLSVHEGPASISKRGKLPLSAGMVLSNEPGYYRTGDWGIRIENLVVVVPADNHDHSNDIGDDYLSFETLSLCPIDRRLIAVDSLDAFQINWVNDYHQRVFEMLNGQVSSAAKEWLASACAPL